MSDLGAERQHQSLRLKMASMKDRALRHAQRPAGLFRPDREYRLAGPGLAGSRSIVVTESVVENAHARELLETKRAEANARRVA